MGADIRKPIGLMFAVLGFILTVFGMIGDQTIYARSLGINVNSIWGGVLLAFGLLMLIASRTGSSKSAQRLDSKDNAPVDVCGRE
jgi:hypothetical protein